MTYDHEVILINEVYVENEIGERVTQETRSPVLCGEKSVGRSEYYAAATAGHKPEVVLVVHRYEYAGQTAVEYEGVRYSVLRTYAADNEEIELTCERVAAHG